MKCTNCGKKLDNVDSECGWCTFCGHIQESGNPPKA